MDKSSVGQDIFSVALLWRNQTAVLQAWTAGRVGLEGSSED